MRSKTVEGRAPERARLVLMAADGASNRDIGAVIGMHYNQVAVWRRRYAEFGLAGLADGERSGRPPVYDHDDVLPLVKTVTQPPPDEAERWTMEAIARRLSEHGVGISASQVWRICRSLDLEPWQTEQWMTSQGPGLLGEGRRHVRPLSQPARQRCVVRRPKGRPPSAGTRCFSTPRRR